MLAEIKYMLKDVVLFKLDVNNWILLGIIKAKPTTCVEGSVFTNHSELQPELQSRQRQDGRGCSS